MNRFLCAIVFLLIPVVTAFSQTPVECLILKYENTPEAKHIVVSGAKMTLVRNFLKSTPVASIASEVDEVAVLKMGSVPAKLQSEFLSELHKALVGYDYYGQHNTKNGVVDIYVLKDTGKSDKNISELVIYNPKLYSLNCLHGSFTTSQLLQLARRE